MKMTAALAFINLYAYGPVLRSLKAIYLCFGKAIGGYIRPTVADLVGCYPPSMTTATLYNLLKNDFGMSDRDIMRELTPVSASIARAVGVEAAVLLLDRLGGRRISFPENVTEEHVVAQLIGVEAAVKVRDVLPCVMKQELPNNFGIRTLIRLMGCKLLRQGWSINKVVSELGVTRSTVKDWKRQMENVPETSSISPSDTRTVPNLRTSANIITAYVATTHEVAS